MKGLFATLFVIGLAGYCLALCPNPCNKSNQYTKQPCQGDCNKFWMCNAYLKGVDTSHLISCGTNGYFDPIKQQCSADKKVCGIQEYSDPCNKANQFSKQPCKEDCTKFWMCNAYVKGLVTSKLFDCSTTANGKTMYWDPLKKYCTLDSSVCQ